VFGDGGAQRDASGFGQRIIGVELELAAFDEAGQGSRPFKIV
jgi:hypothetical protein